MKGVRLIAAALCALLALAGMLSALLAFGLISGQAG